MDTRDAGRMGGLKGGAKNTQRQVRARNRNLKLAQAKRWPLTTIKTSLKAVLRKLEHLPAASPHSPQSIENKTNIVE